MIAARQGHHRVRKQRDCAFTRRCFCPRECKNSSDPGAPFLEGGVDPPYVIECSGELQPDGSIASFNCPTQRRAEVGIFSQQCFHCHPPAGSATPASLPSGLANVTM